MAKLTAKKRKHLKSSQFAEPGKRKYPINDKAHARNALARVAQHGTPSEKAAVKRKVHAKFPGIGIGGKKTKNKKHQSRKRVAAKG
jgi:hypothetical protein